MTINYKNIIFKSYYKNKILFKKKPFLKNYLNDIYSSLNTRKDIFHTFSKKYKFDFNNKKFIKYKKFKNIVIIGMGGSILGSEAIYFFLKNKIKNNFIFLDNLDETKKYNIINSKKNLFVIISKSGNTLETITNVNLIKKNVLTSNNTIVVSSRKNSALYLFSKKNKIPFVEHKNYIGGRYSILSEVGVLPAFLMGLDVKKFRKNTLSHFNYKKKLLLIDSVLKISQIYLSKKFNSIVFLNYCPQLNKFLYWYQQLVAESLGKKGKGLIPIVSEAPKDHHSLLQLYLDGPKDKLFYIFSSEFKNNTKLSFNHFGKKYDYLKNKNLHRIVNSQKSAFTDILKKKNIPFREIIIKKADEQVLGELFSYFIIETVLISKLIHVNPYDQPAVESVKALTKKYLS